MITNNESDNRFSYITEAEILSVYQKIPTVFGGFLIIVSFKEKENSIFPTYLNIDIDGRNFLSDLEKLEKNNSERLCYANGMCDIDFYIDNKGFNIRWSPNEGRIVYISLKKGEFEKLLQSIKIK